VLARQRRAALRLADALAFGRARLAERKLPPLLLRPRRELVDLDSAARARVARDKCEDRAKPRLCRPARARLHADLQRARSHPRDLPAEPDVVLEVRAVVQHNAVDRRRHQVERLAAPGHAVRPGYIACERVEILEDLLPHMPPCPSGWVVGAKAEDDDAVRHGANKAKRVSQIAAKAQKRAMTTPRTRPTRIVP
jgi:hypothetical protein